MTRADMRRLLIDWLDDHYHFGDAESKIGSDDASFLDKGVLDSLGFVALVVYLEDTFRVTIDRRSLNRENFDSVDKILGYVEARTGAVP
jgi:acyl carrier protein